MAANVLDYLEAAAKRFPECPAYCDGSHTYTFSEVRRLAGAIGSGLGALGLQKRPVVVWMEKGADMAAAFLGIVFGGLSYCPLDVGMPKERIEQILSSLCPAAMVASKDLLETAAALYENCPVFSFETLCETEENPTFLAKIRSQLGPSDCLSILYTSGSTGIPKGVAGTHGAVINYLEWLASRYTFGPEDVLGNQVPLHFAAANHDLYCPLRFGCSVYFLPPEIFMFPNRLVALLNEKRVTAVLWVPFALGMAARLRAFEKERPEFLRYVFFIGEVMPVKQLNYWRDYIPDALYVNLYGCTEAFICCFYEIRRAFSEDETLPVGGPLTNVGVCLLSEDGRLLFPENSEGREGELCVFGAAAGGSYYGDLEGTSERFIRRTEILTEPDGAGILYRTGDLARFREDGELFFSGRLDEQIKHLGYRIELGEIEAAARGIEGVENCVCVYDGKKEMILFYYEGVERPQKEISRRLSQKLPRYMLPGRYMHMERLPRNANGKVDRRRLL
ncbi:MAG: AMP-binding protein [Lachnospiraceae bacterium]|nr:AMP-binding protein [Lachnospiraceae bacterium]